MREFFKPWRRKIGVLTLGLACVLMVGWMRSLLLPDLVFFPFLGRQQVICISGGHISWTGTRRPEANLQWHHFSGERYTRLHLVLQHLDSNVVGQRRSWECPYWSIVLPPTLLSAYLLLSKQPSTRTTTEPSKDEP